MHRQQPFWTRLVIGGTAIAIGILAYGSYRTVRSVTLRELRENAFLEAQRGKEEIDRWLALQKSAVSLLANTPTVQSMDWTVVAPYLQREVDRLKADFHHAILVRPDGTYFFTGIGYAEGKTVADRAYFTAAMNGEVVVSDPILSRATGLAKVNAAAPIGDRDDPSGVLLGGIKIDRIAAAVRDLEYGAGSYAFALNRDGRAIVHPDPDLTFNLDRPQAPRLAEAADPGLAAIARKMTAGDRGVEILEIDGQAQYVAYMPLAEVDWSIALVVPRANIDAQLRPLDRIAWASGLLAIGLLAALGIWQRQAAERRKLVESQRLAAEAKAELEARVAERTAELSQALQDLQAAQLRLVQSEKMSGLGQLVAGVAHEINNPVSFIHGNLVHAKEYADQLLEALSVYEDELGRGDRGGDDLSPEARDLLEDLDADFLKEDFPKLLASMKSGTDRIRDIVRSLRTFSRMDEAEIKAVDLHPGLDSTLTLLHNRLRGSADRPEITVERHYGDLPQVECYAGELNQAFMNLAVNAIEAIEERYARQSPAERFARPGCIRVVTRQPEPGTVEIAIADNGTGMDAATCQKIFDPFFTTKPIGQGTGMGLAMAYAIAADRHRGSLTCQSEPCVGTEFVLALPVRSPHMPAEPLAAAAGTA